MVVQWEHKPKWYRALTDPELEYDPAEHRNVYPVISGRRNNSDVEVSFGIFSKGRKKEEWIVLWFRSSSTPALYTFDITLPTSLIKSYGLWEDLAHKMNVAKVLGCSCFSLKAKQ